MGNVSYRFFLSLFTSFLWLMVFVNFTGWSGAYVNVASAGNVGDWQTSYFGFQSIQIMTKALDKTMNAVPLLSVKQFPIHLNDFLNTCAFGLPQFIEDVGVNGADVLKVLKLIGLILIQPIVFLKDLFLVVAHILYYAFNFISVLLLAVCGYFNVPLEDTINYSELYRMASLGSSGLVV